VEMDEEVGGGLFDPAVLDVGDGVTDEASGGGAGSMRAARDIEDAGEGAFGGVDGHGAAGEEAVLVEEVLGSEDLDEAVLDDGGADGVGAGDLFPPGGAGGEGDGAGAAEEGVVALEVEDDAVGVGEEHDAAGVGKDVLEEVHFAKGEAAELLGALLMEAEIAGGKDALLDMEM
jgi:hypothetical protein